MMTDPMKPLGLSVWLLTTRAPMYEAGGRLFVDVTQRLATLSSRAGILEALGRSDPLIRDALQTVLDRGDFVRSLPEEGDGVSPAGSAPAPIEADPAIVEELIGRNQASVAALKRSIQTRSGSALLDFVLADIQELQRILFDPHSHQVFMAAMDAAWWLNEQLQAWLGEKNAADTLTQSVPHNVTSEMGWRFRRRRRHPSTRGCGGLSRTRRRRRFLTSWTARGGRDAMPSGATSTSTACVASARSTSRDLERTPHNARARHPRKHRELEPGAAQRRFEQGLEGPQRTELSSACGPCRTESRRPTRSSRRSISSDVHGTGVSEVRHGQPLLRLQAGLLDEAERPCRPACFVRRRTSSLTFQELHDVVRTKQVDDELIRRRKDAFRSSNAHAPGCSRRMARPSPAYRRDDVLTGAPIGHQSPPGPSKGGHAPFDMAEAGASQATSW
jgi:pyruvate,water dikinase